MASQPQQIQQNIRVLEMDTSTPIDVDLAIVGLGGEPSIFYMMLANLENMTLNPTMRDLVPKYDGRQLKDMKDLAHSLKGASGYIGASRLHYVCYFIQEHYVFQRYEKMLEYYPALIEAAIEFKIHSRQIIAKYKGESYVPSAEDQKIDHSKDFRLEKDPYSGYIYAVRKDQSIASRIQEKKLLPKKPGKLNENSGIPAQAVPNQSAAFESPRNPKQESEISNQNQIQQQQLQQKQQQEQQQRQKLKEQQEEEQKQVQKQLQQKEKLRQLQEQQAQQQQLQQQQQKAAQAASYQNQQQPPVRKQSSKHSNSQQYKNVTGMSQGGQKKHIASNAQNDQNLCDTIENSSVQESCCGGPNSNCTIF